MSDEYDSYLEDIANDVRQEKGARKLATVLLQQWRAGLVPSRSRLEGLRKMLDRRTVCGRLLEDGTCRWLRKFAHLEGLPFPEPGGKMRCHRKVDGTDVERYDGCTGFTKQKGMA